MANLASDVAVRTMGIGQLTPTMHTVWGSEEIAETPYDGSAVQYWDCGVEDVSPRNESPPRNEAHECVRRTESAQAQMDAFFWPDGVVINACEGECDPE